MEVVLPKYDCINYNSVQVRAGAGRQAGRNAAGTTMPCRPAGRNCHSQGHLSVPCCWNVSPVCASRFLLVLLLQKLRMVKDFWLDGVQVKIWKGYVEGGSVYIYLCVCSLLQNCAAALCPLAMLLLLLLLL